MGGYLLAVHNGQGSDANCHVELADESGVVADEQPLSIAENASIFRDLTELAQAPADFGGGSATVSCDRQIAATGLLAGAAFSGLPPVVLSRVPVGGSETTFGVGATLSNLPTGSWTPDVTSGGSFLLSGGNVTIRLDDGGYIEEGDFQYTCQSAGGCVIENRRVTSGTIVQSATGFAPDNSAAFDQFVVGKRFVSVDDSRYYTEFPSAGQFAEVEPGVRYAGTYSYSNTGPNTGTLTLNYSDGDTCTVQITLTSVTTGSSQYTCSDGETGGGNWRLDDSQSPPTGGGNGGEGDPGRMPGGAGR